MKPSIIYFTYRPGGYDILADGLKNQTWQDYELVVIDEMVHRREAARDYLVKEGVKLGYIGPSKQKCFPELAYNVFNALNTGIMKSTGDVLIFLCDYQWLPPWSIARWMSRSGEYEYNTCIVAGGDMFEDHRERDLNGVLSIWNEPWKGSAVDNGCTFQFTWMPEFFELAYTAFPYTLLEKINGFPECYDHSNGPGQFEPMIHAIYGAGGSIIVDNGHKMQMVNHREWQPSENWHEVKRLPQGSTDLVIRPNCFNLKDMERGNN